MSESKFRLFQHAGWEKEAQIEWREGGQWRGYDIAALVRVDPDAIIMQFESSDYGEISAVEFTPAELREILEIAEKWIAEQDPVAEVSE